MNYSDQGLRQLWPLRDSEERSHAKQVMQVLNGTADVTFSYFGLRSGDFIQCTASAAALWNVSIYGRRLEMFSLKGTIPKVVCMSLLDSQ